MNKKRRTFVYPPASEGAVAFVTITDLPSRESKSTFKDMTNGKITGQ